MEIKGIKEKERSDNVSKDEQKTAKEQCGQLKIYDFVLITVSSQNKDNNRHFAFS